MFHLINADPTTVSSSLNSNETVIPSSSNADIRPSVGPLPEAEAWVEDVMSLPNELPVVVSPSASCMKPARITSPVNIPVSVPVSTRL